MLRTPRVIQSVYWLSILIADTWLYEFLNMLSLYEYIHKFVYELVFFSMVSQRAKIEWHAILYEYLQMHMHVIIH